MTCASVTHEDRLTLSNRPRSATTAKTAPKIVNREMVLVLRWKICGIASGDRRIAQPMCLQTRRRRACIAELEGVVELALLLTPRPIAIEYRPHVFDSQE